jgi:hypothetical protein
VHRGEEVGSAVRWERAGSAAAGGPSGARAGEGAIAGGRERGYAGKTKTKTPWQQWRRGSPEKKTSPEPRRKTLIGDEPSVGPMSRRHRDKALDEMNAAVPLDSTVDARIENNCSPELEPSQTSASNSRSFRSRLRMGFRNSERAR